MTTAQSVIAKMYHFDLYSETLSEYALVPKTDLLGRPFSQEETITYFHYSFVLQTKNASSVLDWKRRAYV